MGCVDGTDVFRRVRFGARGAGASVGRCDGGANGSIGRGGADGSSAPGCGADCSSAPGCGAITGLPSLLESGFWWPAGRHLGRPPPTATPSSSGPATPLHALCNHLVRLVVLVIVGARAVGVAGAQAMVGNAHLLAIAPPRRWSSCVRQQGAHRNGPPVVAQAQERRIPGWVRIRERRRAGRWWFSASARARRRRQGGAAAGAGWLVPVIEPPRALDREVAGWDDRGLPALGLQVVENLLKVRRWWHLRPASLACGACQGTPLVPGVPAVYGREHELGGEVGILRSRRQERVHHRLGRRDESHGRLVRTGCPGPRSTST